MRKTDLGLLKKMKETEQAQKQQREADEAPKPSPATISFDLWWKSVADERRFKSHLKEIIWADFKARGLKKVDVPEEYNKALKLFGY